MDVLVLRINRSWTLVVINDAIFYFSFFACIFLDIKYPNFLPWPTQMLLPIVFLIITAFQGLRTINLYLKMEHFQKDVLPSFSWQNFNENTWVQINEKSTLYKKLDVGSSGYIRIKDLPINLKDLGNHILAVGSLNGMRRMNLPVTSIKCKIALIKLGIGLLSAQHPDKGYIYGSDEVVKYFAEQYHIAFGLSGIEVLREYEKDNRHELYISLGRSLAEAILQYIEQIDLFNTSVAVKSGVCEVILVAFASFVIRKQGQYYRPPKIILRRLPKEFRLLLASQGILSSKTKDSYSILICERNKLSHLELTSEFDVLYQDIDIRLTEPFRVYNVAALSLCNRPIGLSYLKHLGDITYGETLANEFHLSKYQEKGLILIEDNQIKKGPFFESYFSADDLKMLTSYSDFLNSLFDIGIENWNVALPINVDKTSKKDYQRVVNQQNEKIKELTAEFHKTKEDYLEALPKIMIYLLLALNQKKISFDDLMEAAYNEAAFSLEFLERIASVDPTKAIVCQVCGQVLDILQCFETGGQCIYCGGGTTSIPMDLLETLDIHDLFKKFKETVRT
ncbi:MAG: hypothetical protein ACFFCZ_07815 [Promethearchaeota archaeon]